MSQFKISYLFLLFPSFHFLCRCLIIFTCFVVLSYFPQFFCLIPIHTIKCSCSKLVFHKTTKDLRYIMLLFSKWERIILCFSQILIFLPAFLFSMSIYFFTVHCLFPFTMFFYIAPSGILQFYPSYISFLWRNCVPDLLFLSSNHTVLRFPSAFVIALFSFIFSQ